MFFKYCRFSFFFNGPGVGGRIFGGEVARTAIVLHSVGRYSTMLIFIFKNYSDPSGVSGRTQCNQVYSFQTL